MMEDVVQNNVLVKRKTEVAVEQQRVVTEKVEQTQRNYYPGRPQAEVRHFVQESVPTQVHRDVYSLSYTSTSDASGHEPLLGTGDRSSTASGGASSSGQSAPNVNANPSSSGRDVADGAQLISRTTQQTKQQQTKTVTKTTVSRETRFIGPDGRAIELDHSGYGTVNGQPSLGFNPHYGNTTTAHLNGHPAGGHPGDFDYHNYQDYPLNPPTPPSLMSDSPPPVRRSIGEHHTSAISASSHPSMMMNNLPPSGYDELDATLQYNQHHIQQPIHDPYGYIGGRSAAYGTVYASHPNQAAFPVEEHHGMYSGSIGGDVLPNGAIGHSPQVSTSDSDVRWRNPDLHEVIEFLSHPEAVVRANAAAYLQHLCFMDDNKKQRTRALGGIPPLVALLTQNISEIQRNACGALRNLSYGRKNDENKRAIRNAGGIPALVHLLRTQPENQDLCELVTGILWNLSSCEDLKRPILDDALIILAKQIILPCSRWDTTSSPNPLVAVMTPQLIHTQSEPLYWSNLFRNATGVLRNISSAGEYARRRMRETEYFVESLIFLVRTAITRNDMDNKSIENVVCILRNLSYRCQEVVDPHYDSHPPVVANTTSTSGLNASLSPSSSKTATIMGSVGSKVDNLSCFGGSKKKDKGHKEAPSTSTSADQLVHATQNMTLRTSASTMNASGQPTLPRSKVLESIGGIELLWQPEMVQPYLALLSGSSNPETLEAAAGAIQNLSACYWQQSVEIRAAVRKEKGLPVLVELLRMEVDRVVCAVATALRNLAMDSRNKELIGKYAMKDLVSKLPNGNAQHDYGTSDDTIAAVLATLNEVVSKNGDFAKSLLEAQGMDRLSYIIKNKNNKFSPRVFKFTSQLLFNMWQHMELRDVYKKAGYKESHFIIRPTTLSRNASSTGGVAGHHNNTLSRPMSTQSGTRYEDRTLPRGGAARSHYQAVIRPEELAMNDMGVAMSQSRPEGVHLLTSTGHLQRPPAGGVAIFPPGTTLHPRQGMNIT